jgi:hypothetical protein
MEEIELFNFFKNMIGTFRSLECKHCPNGEECSNVTSNVAFCIIEKIVKFDKFVEAMEEAIKTYRARGLEMP